VTASRCGGTTFSKNPVEEASVNSPQTTEVVASKVVNALIESVELSPAVKAIPYTGAFTGILGRFRKYYGGLWVGGTATLTNSQLSFEPNAMNRLAQVGELSVVVPLNQINEVTLEKGFFTNIIVVKTSTSTLRLRCYGADEFMQRVRVAANLT
jgi:hypothetical protein